jgi:hypothetical protein
LLARLVSAAVVACSAACGSSSPSPTAPQPQVQPAPAPPATENRAPTVTVTFTGASSCIPHGSFACSLNVAATAADPDGDALTYAWSGCASGAGATAVCTVKDRGKVSAIVSVDDGHGHSATASATGEGEPEPNLPPSVQVGYIVNPAAGPGEIDILGNVIDPEDGVLCGRQYCGGVSTTGDCGGAFLDCTCLAGLEARVIRTATSGVCSVTLEVKDNQGAVGRPTITFDVSTLKVVSFTGSSVVTSNRRTFP